MNQLVAHDLVEFRKNNGPFRDRTQLMQINGIGEARFTQAAGFLKIVGGDNPLDQTWIHPESYAAAGQLLAELGYGPDVLNDRARTAELREKLKPLSPEDVAQRLGVRAPTLRDIIDALVRPGRARGGRGGAARGRGGGGGGGAARRGGEGAAPPPGGGARRPLPPRGGGAPPPRGGHQEARQEGGGSQRTQAPPPPPRKPRKPT